MRYGNQEVRGGEIIFWVGEGWLCLSFEGRGEGGR